MTGRRHVRGDARSEAQPSVRPAPPPAGQLLSLSALANRPAEERAQVLSRLSHFAGNAAVSRQIATLSRNPGNEPAGAAAAGPTVPVEVEFDRFRPWLFKAIGPLTEETLAQALYGGAAIEPFESEQVVRFSGGVIPRLEGRWVAVPHRLVEPYRTQYLEAMEARRAELDEDLDRDVADIESQLDRPWYEKAEAGQRVVDIFLRWSLEPFPGPQSPDEKTPGWSYLDRLLSRLRRETREIGVIADQWTSLYDMVFNRLDVADELRRIQDEHAPGHVGSKAEPEMDVFGTGNEDLMGMFWEDVKSGEVASRIGNYFLGMLDAGVGLVEGVALLLTDPMRALEGIGKLPETLSLVWKHRDRLWAEFVNADSDEQARMIGRLFGEAEILIATVGAGGGGSAARAAPEAAVAAEAIQVGRGGAAALVGGGEALTIDLGLAGGEAARLTSLMAATTEAGGAAEEKAKQFTEPEESFGGVSKELDLPPGGEPRPPGLDAAQTERLLAEARALDTAESVSSNYRLSFKRLHPDFPGGKEWQVHHAIPQKFRKLLSDAGIQVDSPAFLRGVRTTPGDTSNVHAKITSAWEAWHRELRAAAGREPTAAEVIEHAKQIDWRFGGNYWEAEKAAGLPVPTAP
jgi:hypothetical protein